jgi:phage terminase large subunit GpA-like protein
MVPNDDGSLPDGWRHYPQSYTRTSFEQLTAENVKIEDKRGKDERRYRDQHLRNEALDLSVYNLAACRMRQWNFEQIAQELAEKAEALRMGKSQPAEKRRSPIHRMRFSNRYSSSHNEWVLGGYKW